MNINMPIPVKEKIAELENLVAEYPFKIPVNAAAKFLNMDADCLRRSIDQAKCPFAIGCDNGKYGNRYAHIPTAAFYFWYMAPLVKNNVV